MRLPYRFVQRSSEKDFLSDGLLIMLPHDRDMLFLT